MPDNFYAEFAGGSRTIVRGSLSAASKDTRTGPNGERRAAFRLATAEDVCGFIAGGGKIRTLGGVEDYCGYCGEDFARRRSDPPEICATCLADPQVRRQYEDDSGYELARRAHDADMAREQREQG